MDAYLTTAFYLFSALLQADAALIGFGAIFVTYRLQALENQFSFTMQEFKSHGPGFIGQATSLWVAKTDEEKAEILKKSLNTKLITALEFVASLSEAKSTIKRTIKAPLIITGSHLCVSAILLWLVPELHHLNHLLSIASWINVVWFVVAVISSVRVAWHLVVNEKELSLNEVNPKLYKLVHEANNP